MHTFRGNSSLLLRLSEAAESRYRNVRARGDLALKDPVIREEPYKLRPSKEEGFLSSGHPLSKEEKKNSSERSIPGRKAS